jgi:NitT/TauT family transport system substrate-binding protein
MNANSAQHQPSSRPTATIVLVVLLLASVAFSGCAGSSMPGVLRLGYFPNLTHAQALYGVSTGLYQEKLGDTKLETTSFNAGPAAFEALLSKQVDVIYVGPSPTINAIEKVGIEVLVVLSGTASGGAMFVVKPDMEFDTADDFAGKKFATPQLGNTQDVALKHYLLEKGAKTRDRGGQVDVINAQNADILTLFKQGEIQGAWVPEPWGTRLVREGEGKVHVNESSLWEDGDFVTTHLVTTRQFATERQADLEHLLAAHYEATEKVQSGSPEVLDAINDGIEKATGKRIADETLAASFGNVRFTVDPLGTTFQRQYEMSHAVGFAKAPPADLDRIYEIDIARPTMAAQNG